MLSKVPSMNNYIKDSVSEMNFPQCTCDSVGHAFINPTGLHLIHLPT